MSQNKDMAQPSGSSTGKAEAVPAPVIHTVSMAPSPGGHRLKIMGSAPLSCTAIKQAFPFGVVVYFPDTKVLPELVEQGVAATGPVGKVNVSYADSKETMVKVEVLLKEDLAYEVTEADQQVELVLSHAGGMKHSAPVVEIEPVETAKQQPPTPAPKTDPPPKKIVKAPAPKAPTSKTPAPMTPVKNAMVNGIKFEADKNGLSHIWFETTGPVGHKTAWVGERQVLLTLENTQIPIRHRRPLLTQYFNSAVDRVVPVPQSGKMSKDSEVAIYLREKVPFEVNVENNRLTLMFEPSAMQPPMFEKGMKKAMMLNSGGPYAKAAAPVQGNPVVQGVAPMVGGSMPQHIGNPVLEMGMPGQEAMAVGTEEVDTFNSKVSYTGEKIKLDFYDTDIKNVFRILRSVSGKNFAVDKNVQGKVTMALDKPVPWDQVLDLVLKMNGLGRKYENNVIRIATVETLKKEEQDLQETLEARKKAQEQKKSLEPLHTEYIPINYSDASVDIQPNITPLLSKDRGKISVDKRTNMIIVTDTREKIAQIRDMIYRLDTVTPQIMIEAKVVEVNKSFSRSIGLGLQFSNDPDKTSGFINDHDISINKQAGSGLTADISFFNLLGSSHAALEARLDASEQLGNVRIVSSPRILTLDNKTAKIKQGIEYAYLERDDSGGSSVKFKDIDLLLEVTPHVTPDQRISMTLTLTKNDISGVTDDGAPTLSTNEAQTELLVNNNDTVVIGGIVKSRTNKDNKSLPFLSQVPVLNTIFGTDFKEEERNELLIFLTPTIVQLEQKRNVLPMTN
ncbi:MAG: type IV pilus secretin PilQ [Desulfobacterales bacterium]|nr:type IV pilus secretin PilQ [Desulfobacterales bacterium]